MPVLCAAARFLMRSDRHNQRVVFPARETCANLTLWKAARSAAVRTDAFAGLFNMQK